ncbi:MAG: sialidase family protein [Actinomycetota bacterium]
MRRMSIVLAIVALLVAVLAVPSSGRDRPFSTSTMHFMKLLPAPQEFDLTGGQTDAGGQFSKKQIEGFTCEGGTSAGDAVDISCNDTTYGQDWAPDNEIAIAVDPEDPDHLLAGSNDYYYRFNNSTGARQALVPTGFFTSFDGGETWLDGQVPFGSGNGNGDPAPAFDADHDVALMAQLANVGGQGGPWVAAGNVSVSRSLDGGETWQPPVTVFQGSGAGIGPANNAVFWDKVYMGVDNNPTSDFFGRIYVTASRFRNGLQGSYAESPIWLSSSDDGGETWTKPKEISGSNPSCTFQSSGPAGECDEDQDSNPVVASDGTLYVYFLNGQNDDAWEVPFDFDNQVMVVKSTDGGETFSAPVAAAQLEDGLSDMPWSVIGRQTVWGHQIRWSSFGNLSVDPTDPEHIVVTWSDRGAPNPNAGDGSCISEIPGTAPNYDPCDAGPGSTINVGMAESTDGGASWSDPTAVASSANSQWFPWAGHLSDGTLVVAFDQDTAPAPADTFRHVLSVDGAAATALGPLEHIDVSVTHWAGQYTTAWPAVCGPTGYTDPPVTDAEGKDCNVFHGDYTGLAVGPDDAIHVVWTGLNRLATSPQIDFYTGAPHDGYAQDAMYRQVILP